MILRISARSVPPFSASHPLSPLRVNQAGKKYSIHLGYNKKIVLANTVITVAELTCGAIYNHASEAPNLQVERLQDEIENVYVSI
jgi:hypothetical protein